MENMLRSDLFYNRQIQWSELLPFLIVLETRAITE